uniref:PDZ domain-containing protein n=1 Tax=Anopheles culicifacies TaxID=139723 RepID=A0A182MDD2_9DIPT
MTHIVLSSDRASGGKSSHIASSGQTAGTESSEGTAYASQPPINSHPDADKRTAPGSVTSMDSMNNVVTTTTTVTAIASTVHQLIPAPSAATSTTATNGGKVAPPAFSRLPPDGHEFPPNFTEPSAANTTTTTAATVPNGSTSVNGNAAIPNPGPVAAMTIMNGGITAPVLAKSNDKHSSFNDDLPDLPKSHPPPVPRKMSHTPAGDSFRKPPPFPTRSSSIAESMLSRKELPQAYQSLQSVFEQRRRSVDVPDHLHHGKPPPPPTGTGSGRISLVGSNWRKDEKSEKSVRDKIAMFSSAADAEGAVAPVPQHTTTMTAARKFSKDFTKSSENLLGSSRDISTSKKTVEPIETYATLRKKAHSVEHLDEVDRGVSMTTSTATSETPFKAKFSLETSKPVVLGKAYSVENLNPINRPELNKPLSANGGALDGSKVLARTTSFSGYSNGHSLATIANTPSSAGSTSSLVASNIANSASGSDERWKSSISNLLEQRKKSMSKLRGLVIPEKVPETEVLPEARIIGLPIIKSKDSEIILSSGVISKPPVEPPTVALSYNRKTSTLPMPPKSSISSMTGTTPTVPNRQDSTFRASTARLQTSSDAKHSESESEMVPTFRKPLPPMPPVKPPRTSLVYPPKSESTDCLRSTEDESDDSDSVLSSRVSSPPASPVAPAAPVEKYALTRTLSSETNTSITSSNSTLTSSSGSQASCSSVGSTPAVDISRKLSKSSSSEASMNRKNVLASAKCRNGRGGDLKIEDVGTYGNGSKSKRYEDGDSTDGYEEEERRKSKSKPRSSLTNGSLTTGGKSIGYESEKKPELTHYKVVDSVDSIVDKVIKVASYVEVVSDLEDNAVVEEPIVASAVPLPTAEKPLPSTVVSEQAKKISHDAPNGGSMSDLAKWVRHEAAARTISHKEPEPVTIATVGGLRPEKKLSPPKSTRTVPTEASVPIPTRRELRSSVETKKLNLAEIRKSFESKSANSTVIPTPVKQPPKEHTIAPTPATATTNTPAVPMATSPPVHATPKTTHHTNGGHDRFSSWDSLASSSSGVSSLQTNSLGLGSVAPNCTGSSQTLQSTPSDYGSFSSLGSSHSLITPQDLQLIIEEADPPLATPEAFVVVLQRETPESSIGITLAGGSDYEAKEITIHKILTNSPADRDGRLKKGDRILSINGLSMRGLTHRESLSVLKTPRPEVVMVITRSKSLVLDTLAKLKRPSMGSLSSLAEKSEIATEYERKLKIQHKASRSLDLDHLDVGSNEAESVFDGTASEDGLLSADDVSKCSSSNATDNASFSAADVPEGCRMVQINKDGAGLGFSIEGGYDSPTGNKPLIIKKIFMGGAAEKSGLLRAGEEIVAINDISIAKMTRIQVWNMMKKLPNGGVRITLK